jgi:predicted TIM-barrel fold metal-dependent hydrolase
MTRRSLLAIPAAALAVRAAAPRRFIIDGHQHWASGPNTGPEYVAALVKNYQPRNAMVCVNAYIKDWDQLKAAVKQHSDVIIPYGRILIDNPESPAEIDRFAAEGARGIKMHKPRNNWDDPHYFPVYERIDRLKLLALFHTGIASHTEQPEYSGMARMRPEYLDTISRAFPNLYIQGAHLGNPWYETAAEVARWSPRLYFDVTGSTLTKKARNLAIFKDYLWWEGPGLHSSPHAVPAFEKIVFGTDEEPSHLPSVIQRYEAMLDACGVPEPIRKKVYGETLAGILGIKPRV